MAARARSGALTSVISLEPLSEQSLDLLLRHVRMQPAKRGSLEPQAHLHQLQRLRELRGRRRLTGEANVVFAQRIHEPSIDLDQRGVEASTSWANRVAGRRSPSRAEVRGSARGTRPARR